VTTALSYLADDRVDLADLYDDSDGLAHLAAHAGAALEGSTPQEILRWAFDRFGSRIAIASSMADGVLPHMAAQLRPGVPVLFLDTGYHFAETIGTRDAVADSYDVTLLTIQPRHTVAQQDAEHGPRLYARDPDLCCALRKVAPLDRALGAYDAWISGIRRDETEVRSDIGVIEWDAKRGKVKVNPLAAWTQADVDAYVEEHGVLINPLRADGYDSVGCAPCTLRGNGRAGRWAGTGKIECGLHV